MDYFPKQSIYVSNLKNKIIETMRTFLLNGQDSNLSELSLMVLETILVDHLSTAQYADVLFIYPLNNIKYCCKTSLKTIKRTNVGPAGLEPAVQLRRGFTVPAATNYRLRARKTDVHLRC